MAKKKAKKAKKKYPTMEEFAKKYKEYAKDKGINEVSENVFEQALKKAVKTKK